MGSQLFSLTYHLDERRQRLLSAYALFLFVKEFQCLNPSLPRLRVNSRLRIPLEASSSARAAPLPKPRSRIAPRSSVAPSVRASVSPVRSLALPKAPQSALRSVCVLLAHLHP